MKDIRQLLIAWMLVAFLVLHGFGKDVKPPPPPPKPQPLQTKIIPKYVSDENSSGNDDKLKLTTIKQRRTIKIPPRKPVPVLDWSDFIYNSPEEKAFWDELPEWGTDWTDSLSSYKSNAQGQTIESNSSEGFNGYVKDKWGSIRTIYQFVDGYAVRKKSWYSNGQKSGEFKYKDGKLDGLSTWWHENGQKSSEGNYKYGERDGLSTSWYENGQKKLEHNYKEGKEDGLSTGWYENGQKKYENSWKDGKEDGLLTGWYENGQKSSEGNYKYGERDGLQTNWYENGQKKSETNYKDGKKAGLSTEWYENGQISDEENYKEGLLSYAKVWLPDGKECPESKVIDGNGTLVTYSLDGKEISRKNIRAGRTVFPLGKSRTITIPPRNPQPIPKRPLVLSEANSTTRPRYMPTRSKTSPKLPDWLRKRHASSEANSSKPTPPSLSPWLVLPAAQPPPSTPK